ncbi:MAG: NAD(P)H-dependent oxidoreductase [Bacillota bacterium]
MIIVDKALEQRYLQNNPIRVGMIGAGFMAKAIAHQLCCYVKGIELVAISNRNIEKARTSYKEAGIDAIEVRSIDQLNDNVKKGKYSITQDPMIICQSEYIDAIIEVTGAIEFAANVVLEAIKNHKHVIMMDAELDGTVGPILKVYADGEGVILTNSDGDQPGVIMNLYRFVKGLGVRPVLCGNIKGLHDPYRNPTTQVEFAKKWGQKPHMVASFADGSKISFEQAIVANATGMRVAKRGMYGPTVAPGTHLKETVNIYPLEEMIEGPGIVDYVVGAEPAPGVFVLGTHDHPLHQHYLNLYKLGSGPLYCFYTPYHLCHFEIANSVARAVIFGDAAITPLGAPCVDVAAAAKRDLKAGETIDPLGYYMTYGLCENWETSINQNLLPIGAAEGCVLKNDIAKDQVLRYDDVELPEGRLIDKLLKEQKSYFASQKQILNSSGI